jgi:hypothetical protein
MEEISGPASTESLPPKPPPPTARTTATKRSPRPRSAATTRRPASTGTRRGARTPRGGAAETLSSMVDELIKENRKLKHQLDRLATKATGATGSGIERGLRSIQRRVERALSGSPARKTRRTATRRATDARRRKTTAKKAAAE